MLKNGIYRALGAMSGTSLDGVDAAVIETDGQSIHSFGPTAYRAYSEAEREVLRGGLGKWPGDKGLGKVAKVLEAAHVEVFQGFDPVDLVGFHGQTLAHDPAGRGTHQAGNGRRLAKTIGLPVVWDFRSNDVSLGGQGAPLAPAFHFALAKWAKFSGPVVFLNLGGVGNVTWVDPAKEDVGEEGAVLAFDTGPANAPINDLMQEKYGKPFDEGGALAAQGVVAAEALAKFSELPYFFKMPPKSLDRNDFDAFARAVRMLPDADAAATLTAAAAVGVVRAAEHFPAPPERILVTGGGRHNPVMMEMIAEGMDCPVEPVEAYGMDGDMLEAQAFAYLAVRVARGMATSFPSTTGVSANVGGGEFSRPEE
ncbi:anhydro-N-acetylmuramic acid kinase [Alphaproteobacteria bacterium KMM 3653]|uniref:Anhydro-N-acetylmuramic acid kinase n=1 Tax=Harenicola maris TaxID=2841044 RepID=A0AAP2CN55_9RHOB|nr:anhydro-N-acetylmuramic acid kinase [Harenicola maris]